MFAAPIFGCGEKNDLVWLMRYCDVRMVGSDLRRVCLVIGGGEGESPRISEVIVFATTLECDGDSVRRMSCVDDSGEMVGANGMNGLNIGTAYVCSVDGGVPGSPLDGVVCLSVNIISVVVLILSGRA